MLDLDDSYIYIEKHAKIRRLQKKIRKSRLRLLSMVMLAILPLLTVLAGTVASAPHALNASEESEWFLSELSTESILMVMAIWTVPLLLIMKTNRSQIDADRASLFELKQEISTGPF